MPGPSHKVNINMSKNVTNVQADNSGKAIGTCMNVNIGSGQSGPSEQDLKQGYEKLKTWLEDQYKTELSWQTPLKWLPQLKIKADKFYVDLDFSQLDHYGIEKKTQPAKDLNYLYTNGLKERRTLISGEGGFGKTTLCFKMAYDWASNAHPNLSKFGLLMVYHLRDLAVLEEEETLEEQLLKFCQLEEVITCQILQGLGGKFILILDGLDEISAGRKEEVYDLLRGSSAFHQATVLVTSRKLKETNYHEHFSQLLKIKGLSEDTQDKMVQNYLNLEPPFQQGRRHNYRYGDDTVEGKIERFLIKLNEEARWSKSSDFIEENGLSPFLLFLVIFCYQESSSPINSRFDLFKNILEVMGKRCCEKLGLAWTTEEREEVLLKIGKFFCDQREYCFTYEGEQLESTFEKDSEFVLGFCLFCKVASRSGLRTKFSYQLSHKLLYDYIKLNFIRSAASKSQDIFSLLRNGFGGINLRLVNSGKTSDPTSGSGMSGLLPEIILYMDIGNVVVGNDSSQPSAKAFMKPDSAPTGRCYFSFPKAPGNLATVADLFDFQFNENLGELFSKVFKWKEEASLKVYWPEPESDQSQYIQMVYDENNAEYSLLNDYSNFPFQDLLKKLSTLLPSSNRKLRHLGMRPLKFDLLHFLFNDFFSFELKMPAWDSAMTNLDILHFAIRIWMSQEDFREDLILRVRIDPMHNVQFKRRKGSNKVSIQKRDDKYKSIPLKEEVRTVEAVLSDSSYLNAFPELINVKGIDFHFDFDIH